MIARELWQEIMNYGEFDRMPVLHWRGWDETHERWIREGMPADVDQHEYFGATPCWALVSIDSGIWPAFTEEVLEETEEYRIFRDSDGVIKQDWKHKSCIPHFIDFTFKEAKDWPAFKERLQPDPGRIPENLDERIAQAEASGAPIEIKAASMMGWTRNWMGVENMSYLIYDAPDVYADIVNTLADLSCWAIDQIMPRMKTTPDFGQCWEDICGKSGPLVSPHIFQKHVAPGYRKIREKLESYGIRFLVVDCDGFVEPLVGHWLDAGVNVQFPVEIGTWNADPHALRKKFGKELRIFGGFNKLVLEKDRAAIDAEIERRLPLMKEGGFVILPDHLITPGTPLENYKYYLERIRELRF